MSHVMFGLPIAPLTMEAVLARCDSAIATRDRLLIGVVNAAKIVGARSDAQLRESLLDCDVILADGQAVVWAGSLLRCPLPERVAGIDLFTRLLERADRDRLRIYLLGARPEVLRTLCRVIAQSHPNLTIAGARDGYFAADEAEQIAGEIRDSRSDMLFIGISSPQKECFLAQYSSTLGVPVLHGVGGSFDVVAGFTKRAPMRWQRAGCEWAYRLAQEPRRMWRRYLTTNTAFLSLLLKERVIPTPPYEPSSRSVAVELTDAVAPALEAAR